ncbi:MAG: DDE-type integrase/transposase/recombinase, partial [Gammaproteobacteria bacterium]|nr:DDE-type integrase/transposase/recombinase [Gammaproteobacteria bacterium]
MKYLEVTPGQTIAINGRQCTIESVLSLYHVLVRDTETGEISKVPIEQIRPQEDASQVTRRDISEFSDKEWERIEARYATIEPLVGRDERTVEEVKAAATEAGVHIATIYRWLEAFERTGDKAALLPQKPSGGRKKGRLDEDVERVLQSVLRDAYLSSQRHTPSYVIQEVRDRCRALNLRAPTETTIRTRMSWIDERERIKAREGSKAARDAYEPRPGKYVAQAPLSVVQIDHTPVNVMVVDEVDRRTLGRPWITVAIDVYSRMVVGFYLSLDRPSALSVGMCIAQGVLPKQSWLTRHGVTGSWPVWGFPAKVHADNAKEFRGKMLAQACKLYHCDLEWRPVGVPNYGGHIESLCGTLSEKFNNLEGTTFSN